MLSAQENLHLWWHHPLATQPYQFQLSWVRRLISHLRYHLVQCPIHHLLLRSHRYCRSTLPLPNRCWRATQEARDQWCFQHQRAPKNWVHMLRSWHYCALNIEVALNLLWMFTYYLISVALLNLTLIYYYPILKTFDLNTWNKFCLYFHLSIDI